MENVQSNAKRFLDAFNNIDYTIKTRYGFNRAMGFSELIRKAVSLNYIVRKYEDDLVDYGRLRNAIIHNNNEDFVIAEPHLSVVEKIEYIETLLTAPPKALDTVCRKNVLTVDANVSMLDVITLMANSQFSNLPVYKNQELIGIANGQKILNSFGQFLLAGGNCEVFLENVKIEDMLSSLENNDYYKVVPADFSVEQVLNEYHSNPKLLALIFTKTGSTKELPLGILTGADVLKANNLLESY